ncbi:hypothetical protein OH77DRAFT_1516568 [Trametes cingulata]|nr:hypothetical protein OH77DRAFT_1516568 [Trametes cingulata]
MPVALKRAHYEVMASILKSHAGARRELRWSSFEKALGAIGFVGSAHGTLKRTFRCTGPWPHAPFSLQKPNNNVLSKRDQDALKALFLARYGWRSSTFTCKP